MNSVSIIILSAIIVTFLDWLDQFWFNGMSLFRYGEVIIRFISAPPLVTGIFIISIFNIAPEGPELFTEWNVLIVTTGIIYIGYINLYNFFPLPTRLFMILLPNTSGVTSNFRFSTFLIHPTLIYYHSKHEYYLYSLTSERSYIIYFDSKDELINTVVSSIGDKDGPWKKESEVCDSCGEVRPELNRFVGAISGYKGYTLTSPESELVELNAATSRYVTLCTECQVEEFTQAIKTSEAVEESVIVSHTI